MPGPDWKKDETDRLVSQLRAGSSAGQVAKELGKTRSGIYGKVGRMRHAGVSLAKGFTKWLGDDPRKRPVPRRGQPPRLVVPLPQPPPEPSDLATDGSRHCSLIDLDDRRCHWPIGPIDKVAGMFCGAEAVLGRCYCEHHLKIGRG